MSVTFLAGIFFRFRKKNWIPYWILYHICRNWKWPIFDLPTPPPYSLKAQNIGTTENQAQKYRNSLILPPPWKHWKKEEGGQANTNSGCTVWTPVCTGWIMGLRTYGAGWTPGERRMNAGWTPPGERWVNAGWSPDERRVYAGWMPPGERRVNAGCTPGRTSDRMNY